MSTAHGVTQGSYSDYRVLCICPSKTDAQAIADKINAGDNYEKAEVAEFRVVDAATTTTDITRMSCNVWDDGRTEHLMERTEAYYPWDYGYSPLPVSWRWVRTPMHDGKGGRLEVQGSDAVRVRKVYSDRRAQLLAEDAFRRRKEVKG